MVTALPKPSQKPAKPPHTGGRPVKITNEIIERIADRVCDGLPLKYACGLETPPFTAQHFEQSLERAPVLSLYLDKRIALRMQAFLAELNNPETKLRSMPASVWIWERRFSQFFAQPKASSAPTVNVNVGVAVGLEDTIRQRAAQLARKPKALRPSSRPFGKSDDLHSFSENSKPNCGVVSVSTPPVEE